MNENLNLQKLLNHNLNPTMDNLQIIYTKLQQLQYFNTFIEKNLKGTQRESLLYLCGKFRMEHFKGGDVIFKEGDKSNDKLYIIFNGKVALMKSKPQLQSQQQIIVEKTPEIQKQPPQTSVSPQKPSILIPQKTTNSIGSSQGMNFFRQVAYSKRFADKMKGNIVLGQTNERISISQLEMQQLSEKYGETIKVMKRGEGFGDRALLENVPRALTACAYTQDLFLLILKKDDFDIIRQQFIQQMKEKKSLIFTKFPVQGDYSSKQLEQLAYSFDVEQFSKNTVLTVDGLLKKSFYLIQYGDILLEKVINDQMTKICILTKGQLLGEEIVINEDGCCEYNSIVLSNEATVMVIHKHEFLQKFPEECKRWVKEEYKAKTQFRRIFQSTNLESVNCIGKPKFEVVKQFIDVKINPKKIKSQEREEQLEIGDIIKNKTSIYPMIYQSNPKLDLNLPLFGQDLYKSPKIGHSPDYSRINSIPLKSFKQDYMMKLCRKKRKQENFYSPILTSRVLTSPTSHIERLSKHKHTFSTGMNAFTPCQSTSPQHLNSRDTL